MKPICCVLTIVFAIFAQISFCDNIGNYRNAGDVMESSTERNHQYSMLCMDVKPQHSVDIEHIMGMWYGSEIIMHTQAVPGEYTYDSCVIIHLSDITEQMRHNIRDYNHYRRTQIPTEYNQQTTQQHQQQQEQNYIERPPTKYLRLLWSEKNDDLEYTFNYTEHSPGSWANVGDQRGSLVTLNHYTQFSGTVQVVKAVNDHLVLTFCGNNIKSSIYTVVLSRQQQGLTMEELRSIRNLLSRRGLYHESVRKVCSSSGDALRASSIIFVAVIALILTTFKTH